MKRVIWTAAATRDLTAMHAYLSQSSAEHAFASIEQMIGAAHFLLEHPFGGPALDYRDWRKWKPRQQRYILIYRPVGTTIEIVRVRHERNDWKPTPE